MKKYFLQKYVLFLMAIIFFLFGESTVNAEAALISSEQIQAQITTLQSQIANSSAITGAQVARLNQLKDRLAILQAALTGTGRIVVKMTLDSQPISGTLPIWYSFPAELGGAGPIIGNMTLPLPNGTVALESNPVGPYSMKIQYGGIENFFSDINFWYLPQAPAGSALDSVTVSGCSNADNYATHYCALAANGTITYTFNFTHQKLQSLISQLKDRVAGLTELFKKSPAGSVAERLRQAETELTILQNHAAGATTDTGGARIGGNMVSLSATLNGQPWNGDLVLTYKYPGGTGFTTFTFPGSVSGNPAGTYNIGYISGAPIGAILSSIIVSGCGNANASASNCTLVENGAINYIFNFTSGGGTSTGTGTIQDQQILAQIQQIQNLIKYYENQIAALISGTTGAGMGSTGSTGAGTGTGITGTGATGNESTVVQGCVDIPFNLTYGSRDETTNGAVSQLQDYLQVTDYLNVNPTGYFGLLTLAAVKDFQAANGIDSTGFVGPITRAKIKSLTCNSTSGSQQTTSGSQQNTSGGHSSTGSTRSGTGATRSVVIPEGTGTIRLRADYEVRPWSGTISVRANGGPCTSVAVPSVHSAPSGMYTLGYCSGGPGTFVSMSPYYTMALWPEGDIEFTLHFRAKDE